MIRPKACLSLSLSLSFSLSLSLSLSSPDTLDIVWSVAERSIAHIDAGIVLDRLAGRGADPTIIALSAIELLCALILTLQSDSGVNAKKEGGGRRPSSDLPETGNNKLPPNGIKHGRGPPQIMRWRLRVENLVFPAVTDTRRTRPPCCGQIATS
ncbi:hypothetical protein GW17_00038142 [Ensete ventricosum]|nr:hypothetical protein GW17_00038142 [Ensete ventricosum]